MSLLANLVNHVTARIHSASNYIAIASPMGSFVANRATVRIVKTAFNMKKIAVELSRLVWREIQMPLNRKLVMEELVMRGDTSKVTDITIYLH
jgi:hypothetical protein